jgi:hypothetical protein
MRLRLMTILPRLLSIGFANLQDLLKEFPEAMTRSAVLVIYDESSRMAFWVHFEGGRPVISEVDPTKPPAATNIITMHVDTFIKILKGDLDFRTAYLYDLVDIKSNDGLPAAYHFLLWSAFFDKVRSAVGW